MTDDHVFIDGLGSRVSGHAAMREGWALYFAMVPDYRIEVQRELADGDTAALFGFAEGTFAPTGALRAENRWRAPAAWRAVVRDGRVAEWQVYVDNQRMHELIAKTR